MEFLNVFELQDRLPEILRRVEAGQSFTVRGSGRDVARIVPLDGRPRSVPWSEFGRELDKVAADPSLGAELREHLMDTTDDID